MYRMLQRWEVHYGHFREFMETLDEVNTVLQQRGWVKFTPWVPTSGVANQVVLISDYPDVAAYKKEEEAAYADAEFMKAWRAGAQFVVQGSGHIELLEPAPHLA
jgi:quinol monooxygenase YgiN